MISTKWTTGKAMGTALLVLSLTLPLDAHAQERECSNATLKGDYGALIRGTRTVVIPGNPPVSESFVGIALRRFDGKGGFTEVAASQHGAVTGAFPTLATGGPSGTGTYQVNANCTGTSKLEIPAANLTIVSDFVIVDNGKKINEIVTSPAANVVTAVYTRK